ncbi:MAG: C10 family peptidase, partial [Kiritimatiellae bacterium]|nr:C10 family peptidase [Kiritimatiellia bacterium]
MKPRLPACLIAAAAMLLPVAAKSAIIDESAIESAAKNFISQGAGAAVLKGRDLQSVARRGHLWVAEYSPSGYAVFSGSDKCEPVIVFGEGSFREPGEDEPFFDILKGADDGAVNAEAGEGSVNPKWARLLGRTVSTMAKTDNYGTVIVEPFLKSQWSQFQPYNDFSPVYTNIVTSQQQGRLYCGCVATAVAQVMKYWEWPVCADSSRTVTHAMYRDKKGENKEDFTVRFDRHEPIDWGSISNTYFFSSYSVRSSVDESVRFPVAKLLLYCDSLANMMFWVNGSASTFSIVKNNLPEYDGTLLDNKTQHDDTVAETKASLQAGIPVLVSMPNHAVVGHGWAEDGSSSYVYINYGQYSRYGSVYDGYYNMSDTTSSKGIESVFVGFKPKANVVVDSLPAVIGTSATVSWRFPKCYDDSVTGFTLWVDRVDESGVPQGASTVLNASGTARSITVDGLTPGERYAFQMQATVTGAVGGLSNTVKARVAGPGETALGFPEIQLLTSPEGAPDFKENFYRECAVGTNVIYVQCSESVTALEALPSHLSLVPDDHVEVHSLGSGRFAAVIDGSAIPDYADRSRMIVTLKATDSNGTSVYKDLSLRFSKATAAQTYVEETPAPTVHDKPVADAYGMAFGYFFNGGTDGKWETRSNWSRNGAYTNLADLALTGGNIPQTSGSEVWAPLMFDGNLMTNPEAAEDGMKHVTSPDSTENNERVEGWEMQMVLTNSVCVEIGRLRKMQAVDVHTKIAVDETSRLIVKNFAGESGSGNCAGTHDFYVSSPSGIVFEAEFNPTSAATAFNYNLAGKGSVQYASMGGSAAPHYVKSLTLDLGDASLNGKKRVSRKLIGFTSKGSHSFSSEGVEISASDPAAALASSSEELGSSSAVGTYRFHEEADGYYVDYVAYACAMPLLTGTDDANEDTIAVDASTMTQLEAATGKSTAEGLNAKSSNGLRVWQNAALGFLSEGDSEAEDFALTISLDASGSPVVSTSAGNLTEISIASPEKTVEFGNVKAKATLQQSDTLGASAKWIKASA